MNQSVWFKRASRRTKSLACEKFSDIEHLEIRAVPAVIDLATLGAGGVTIFGAEADDQSGGAVANAGDVNGDGYDDIFIGASNSGGISNSEAGIGECYLIFGGPSLPSTLDLNQLGTAGVVIYGINANDLSGSAVSGAGDVNKDGFGDLLIGAPFADGLDDLRIDSGETYLIYGKAAFPSTIDLSALGASGVVIYGRDAYDGSGSSVSKAGDVNGDGFADLMIGASQGDGSDGLKDGAGETYIVFGGPALPSTLDLAMLGTSGIVIYGVDSDDLSGTSVANGGDINLDGFDDVLIGAPGAAGADNSLIEAGETYLIFGGAALPASIELASLGSAGVTVYGADQGDGSGAAVSRSGDLNGDGVEDFVIGANRGDGLNNMKNGAGESYVVFGGASLPASISLATLGSMGITVYGAHASDGSGSAVSNTGDVNGDGFDDLLIGAGRVQLLGDARLSPGVSYVIFGSRTVSSVIDLDNLGANGLTMSGIDLGDRSGQSVSFAGDVNGDGIDDFLIGAVGGDGQDNSKASAGESYIVFGTGNHLPSFVSSANIRVNENVIAAFKVVATDSDVPVQTLAYSITGGADQSLFSISADGTLSFVAAADFEMPVDVGLDNVYNLEVSANDGHGGLTNQNITVTVLNVNETPVFTSPDALTVSEKSLVVGTVTATDPDLPAQTITFAITGGVDQGRFVISPTGTLSFVETPDFKSPKDVGADNIYNLEITARDGQGGERVQSLSVTVSALNSGAPVFSSSSAYQVAENSTSVGTVVASTATSGLAVTYAITGGVDQAKFIISSGGALRFLSAPNFESPTDSDLNNVYELQVTASDGSGGQTVQNITVTVTDVADSPTLSLGGTAVSYIKGRAAIPIMPQLTLGGSASLAGGTLTIISTRRSQDRFTLPSSSVFGTIIANTTTSDQATIQIQLNSLATYSGLQAYLRGITFSTKGTGLKTVQRHVDVSLSLPGEATTSLRQIINILKR